MACEDERGQHKERAQEWNEVQPSVPVRPAAARDLYLNEGSVYNVQVLL